MILSPEDENSEGVADNVLVNKRSSTTVQKCHLTKNLIGDHTEGVTTRSKEVTTNMCFISKIESKNVNVTRNKACLVAQGYTQIEGVYFDETFSRVARLEAIKLLLGKSCLLKFKVYQMDVTRAFLNEYLNE